MGDFAMLSRAAILGFAIVGLFSCTPPGEADPAAADATVTETAALAFPDGDMVLCPGDPRCGRGGPRDFRPAVPTCQVQSPQHFTLSCRAPRGGGYQPCPGPGCPNGVIDPDARCKLVDWYAYVECDTASASAPDNTSASQDEPAGEAAAPAQE